MRQTGMTTFTRAIATAALLVLAACGTQSAAAAPGDPSPSATNPLAGHVFESTSVVRAGHTRPLVDGVPLRLWFTTDGHLTARSACNTITGTVAVGPDRLRVVPAQTESRGCSAAGVAQGQWLHGFLSSGPRWTATGGTLVLTWQDTVIRFADTARTQPTGPPPASVPLIGTRWVVDTIDYGKVIENPPGGAVATLTFTRDGRVSGSLGCNAFGGRAVIAGGRITFSEIISTMMACGGGRDELERIVKAILDAPHTGYAQSGRHLSLYGPTVQQPGVRLTAS